VKVSICELCSRTCWKKPGEITKARWWHGNNEQVGTLEMRRKEEGRRIKLRTAERKIGETGRGRLQLNKGSK